MKRLIAALLLMAGTAYADPSIIVNRSSFTKTNESGYIPMAFLNVVMITAPSTGGSLALYNSTWTTNNQISSVSMNTAFDYHFEDLKVVGLWYVTNANVNGATIIYKK